MIEFTQGTVIVFP